ncbi:MAG: pyridoxal phosphate-dependent aminotransferase [Aggregatilineales bacterium]
MSAQPQARTVAATDTPEFAIPAERLVNVNDYPAQQMDIPPSRMFLIKKSLDAYRAQFGADAPTFDASQGDGGASLPGVPHAILDRANELQKKQGTGYDQPYGTDAFRKTTAEQYWQLDAATGWGPINIAATAGGRDALIKAYQAMATLGTGRIGDAIVVSRVPWISYLWGMYGVGANTLLAPGQAEDAWAYTEDALAACVDFCQRNGGRRVAGLVITSPDNPTGNVLPIQHQIELAHKALDLGIPFVLFDWIYRWITTGEVANINTMLNAFTPAERARLIFMDGLTKSIGGSNIRSAHLVASKEVIAFVNSRASHGIVPSFYAQAVAMAAYELGFAKAAATIIEPTNQSREVLRTYLKAHGYRLIMGNGGYYAFIHVGDAIARGGFTNSEDFSEWIAKQYGVAVVPGVLFSQAGAEWIRFSYALPPEKAQRAIERFDEAFRAAGTH